MNRFIVFDLLFVHFYQITCQFVIFIINFLIITIKRTFPVFLQFFFVGDKFCHRVFQYILSLLSIPLISTNVTKVQMLQRYKCHKGTNVTKVRMLHCSNATLLQIDCHKYSNVTIVQIYHCHNCIELQYVTIETHRYCQTISPLIVWHRLHRE